VELFEHKVSLDDLFKAGAHFGHKVRYRNPKMDKYVYTVRSKLSIINLRHTMQKLDSAMAFLGRIVQGGGTVVFVGTKRCARDLIEEAALQTEMPWVSRRWLGGTLTNFKTIRHSLKRKSEIEQFLASEEAKMITKKERLNLERNFNKLDQSIGGIKEMHKLPEALFVVDVAEEYIAISEAEKLGIPVIGIVDTNSSPEGIAFPIPSNDDSTATVSLLLNAAVDVIKQAKAKHVEKKKFADRNVKAAIESGTTKSSGEANKGKEQIVTVSKSKKPAAEPKAAAKAKPEVKPAAEPKVAAKAKSAAKAAAEPKAAAKAKPEVKPAAEPKVAAKAKPEVKPAAEPKATAKAKPAAKPKAAAKAKPAAKAAAKPKATAKAKDK
jgi:small subunit ribosomal protein S2